MIKQVFLVTKCGCSRLENIPEDRWDWRVPLWSPAQVGLESGRGCPSTDYRTFKYAGKYINVGTEAIPIFTEESYG